ncbi:MAG: hypothetical protein DSZ29_07100 [Aquificaceae bacterium]|nr:MAG: hypothetical protein DSZ29_07100 [Aquificaceae bacterium]
MNTENKNEALSTKQGASLKQNDKYILGPCVLSSATGDVYSAQPANIANQSESQVFIKFLPENYPHSVGAMTFFTQEIERVRSGCNVFNIVSFEQANDNPYLVFKLPQGIFLSEKISQKNSYGDLSEVLRLVSKIKNALNTLENCGLIHGCVGVDSIYLSDNNDVILLDSIYVSAKQHQLEQDIEHTETIPNREAIYASPDVCFGRPVSEQDNVFSLACISYHLLSGQHPFGGDNSVAALLAKVRPQRIEGLTDMQWQHLENGMAFAKENRLETMDDFIRGFDKAVAVKKKIWTKTTADKDRETVLARKQAKKLLDVQKEKKEQMQARTIHHSKKQATNPHPASLVASQQNTSFLLDNFQFDLPEWAWIPLSLLSGILTGAIAMGLAMEYLDIHFF